MDITDKLFSSALDVRRNAYAPYSKFKVGAAIYADDLQIYKGCNVENVSFPCGTCAEAGAIAAMISHGAHHISEILIVADSQEIIPPCGACLQRIAEFGSADTIIHLSNLNGLQKSYKLAEMLPHGFFAGELLK